MTNSNDTVKIWIEVREYKAGSVMPWFFVKPPAVADGYDKIDWTTASEEPIYKEFDKSDIHNLVDYLMYWDFGIDHVEYSRASKSVMVGENHERLLILMLDAGDDEMWAKFLFAMFEAQQGMERMSKVIGSSRLALQNFKTNYEAMTAAVEYKWPSKNKVAEAYEEGYDAGYEVGSDAASEPETFSTLSDD